MIFDAVDLTLLPNLCKKIGLNDLVKNGSRVAIKINLAKYPQINNPKTDPTLLSSTIKLVNSMGGHVTIIECANGFLEENLRLIGLGNDFDAGLFEILDLDFEDTEEIIAADGEIHFLPKCLKQFDVRIAIPVASLRENHVFSNNVKLFIGIVPRCHYQTGDHTTWRPRIHENLSRSISNIYTLLNMYSPFHFYINGGNTFIRDRVNMERLPRYYVSDNGYELDLYLLQALDIVVPQYLKMCQPNCM